MFLKKRNKHSRPKADIIDPDQLSQLYLSQKLRKKIKYSLLSLSYKHSPVILLTAFICSTILLIFAIDFHPLDDPLIAWYLFFIFILFIRWQIVKMYYRRKKFHDHFKLWSSLYVVGVALAGISWGIIGNILLTDVQTNGRVFIFIFLIAIAAGGSVSLGSNLKAAIIFTALILVPLVIRPSFINSYSLTSPANITIILYIFYLVYVSIKSNTTMKEMFKLQFEKQILLNKLSASKRQLEFTNIKLSNAATHDHLTGLGNRYLFESKLKQAISTTQNKTALLYIDLDNFKNINDRFGHLAGDNVLIALIHRIKKALGKEYKIFRIGGDELAVIIEDVLDIFLVSTICKKICASIRHPVNISGNPVKITVSIGISIYPENGQDIETLILNADKAMYHSKISGRDSFHYYNEL